LLIGLCCLCMVSACDEIQGYSSGKELRSVIVNADTGEPIPDAIVLALWFTSTGTAGGSELVCFHAGTAITNAAGEYYMSAWRQKSPYSARYERDVLIFAHKPGYRWPYPKIAYSRYTTDKLVPSQDSAKERLQYLGEVGRQTRCFNAGESAEALLPLRRALLDEARSIAQSDDNSIVEYLRERVEKIGLGHD
jgi:hypothetical protein